MRFTLDDKKLIVEQVANVAAGASSAIAAEYIGLNVAEMVELRNAARKEGVYLKVVRNNLARRALKNGRFECMCEGLVGPLILAFSGEEPCSAARVIRHFSKGNDKLVVKLIALDGKLMDPSELARLADMPSLNEARAMLLGLLSRPLGKFVGTMAASPMKFVRILGAKRDQRNSA